MSDQFSWDPQQNDDESFNDRPVEMQDGKWQDVQTVAPAAQPRQAAPVRPTAPVAQAPAQEVEVEEEVVEQEEDYSAVLSDAKLRLAQGSLYEMLMNNNLFQDLDIDPKAVKNVEREVKQFARERMEIMLGMRQEKIAQQYAEFNATLANPFNDLEVQALKALASAATKGATQAPEAQTFSAPAQARKSSLTPIGQGPAKRAAPATIGPKKLPNTPAAPIQRKKNDPNIDKILAEEGVTRAELEAQFPDTYRPIEKPLSELTEDEIVQRNKAAAQRLGRQPVKSSAALPMPDQDTINAHMTNRAAAAASNPQMQSLMSLLTKQK